jgi:glycine/D-amino acid oxidase-like deaminating enzyme
MANYALSYWESDSFLREIDLLIIGGGLVGLQSALAYRRRHPEARIVVLERGPLPIGASTRNAGFACFGSLSEILADLERMPPERVYATIARRYHGLRLLRRHFSDAELALESLGGYELFSADQAASYDACRAALPAINEGLHRELGLEEVFRIVPVERAPDLGLCVPHGLIFNAYEAQIHPGELMRHLLRRIAAADITLLAGTEVTAYAELESGRVEVQTDRGWTLSGQQLLLATNAFTEQLHPLAIVPGRNQVLISHPLPGLRLRGTYHYNEGYVYFRNVGDRVLLGGGRNVDIAGETTQQFGSSERVIAYLKAFAQRHFDFPVEWEGAWSGIIGTGPDKSPIIERVSPRVVAAVRLSGMGVALSARVAEEAADLLAG